MKNQLPNYKLIFSDILDKKYPEKKKECEDLLRKNDLSVLNILELNQKIFGVNKDTQIFNQKCRAYKKSDILQILDYQKNNNLTNTELANHFKISRNTISKWKKVFLV